MTAVLLDRAQRKAIRREIGIAASGISDVETIMGTSRGQIGDGRTARAFVVQKIAQMQRWVAALDAIGWQEAFDGREEAEVTVDQDLAMWARGQAVEIEMCFRDDGYVKDSDLDALTGLRLMAEAVA